MRLYYSSILRIKTEKQPFYFVCVCVLERKRDAAFDSTKAKQHRKTLGKLIK